MCNFTFLILFHSVLKYTRSASFVVLDLVISDDLSEITSFVYSKIELLYKKYLLHANFISVFSRMNFLHVLMKIVSAANRVNAPRRILWNIQNHMWNTHQKSWDEVKRTSVFLTLIFQCLLIYKFEPHSLLFLFLVIPAPVFVSVLWSV